MKKLLAFVLLICHINSSMFLPQGAEEDVYNASGVQQDDINSLIELVAVKLGYDNTADDEDDDSGQNFHLLKAFDYYYEPAYTIIQVEDTKEIISPDFPEHKELFFPSHAAEVATPPPDFTSI